MFISLFSLFYFIKVSSATSEFFTVAKDDIGRQIDLYAPHTFMISRLINDELWGFLMNSVVQVQSIEYKIATKIKNPYAIFLWNGTTNVVYRENNNYLLCIYGKFVRAIPIKNIELIKFDFIRKELYVFNGSMMTALEFPKMKATKRMKMDFLSDFYVTDGKLISTNNCSDPRAGQCRNGKFEQFYIQNYRNSVSLVHCNFIILLAKFAFLKFAST